MTPARLRGHRAELLDENIDAALVREENSRHVHLVVDTGFLSNSVGEPMRPTLVGSFWILRAPASCREILAS